MQKIMVAGSGTMVGKTVVSAILTTMLQGDYWKPVQCGGDPEFDSVTVKNLVDLKYSCIHAPAYTLEAPFSPHHAARLENVTINPQSVTLPETSRPLIIEGVGGVLVPLTRTVTTLDLFSSWACQWVVVSKHYLGSINHTLLTIDALKQRGIPVLGIIFNGEPNLDSEEAILTIAQLPVLGRILPEQEINRKTIERYAAQWKQHFPKLRLPK